MAETIGELQILISGSIQGLQDSLRDTKNLLTNTSRDIMGLGSFLTKGFTAPVVSGLAAVIAEASGAENAISQINSVLKSTKSVAGLSSIELQKLAGSLQETTRFSDEATLGAESLLLTFTKIGKDVFPDATKTVLDMSQALGQDLKSSAIQLGKALNDPIRGITALRRVGVQFSNEQERMIKNFVNTNQLAKAQKIILDELATEFGGSAEAAGKTFSGALQRIGNLWSDVLEKFGSPIIAALEPVLNILAASLAELARQMEMIDLDTAIVVAAFLGIAAAIPPLIFLFGALLSPIGLFVAAIAGIGIALATNFGGIADILGSALQAAKPALTELREGFQTFFDVFDNPHGGGEASISSKGDTTSRTKGNLSKNKAQPAAPPPGEGFQDQFGFGERFKAALTQAMPEIQQAFSDLFAAIGGWFDTQGWPAIKAGISSWAAKTKNEIATNLATSVQNAIMSLITNIQTWFLNNPVAAGIITSFKTAINWVQNTAPTLASTAGLAVKGALEKALTGVGAAIISGIKTALSTLVGALGILPGAGGVVATIQAMINAMASGGYVNALQPYLVGEHGAEMFIPQTAGRILPNTSIAGSGGAGNGGSVVIQNLYVYGVQDAQSLLEELQTVAGNRNMTLGVKYG